MPAIDLDRAVATGLEVKEFVLQHWIAGIFGAIAIYLLKNKYGNELNGIPGPFLAGISPAGYEVYD
jgi:hypothetical protein